MFDIYDLKFKMYVWLNIIEKKLKAKKKNWKNT